ncbi:MAG: hypothetical protein IT385_10995, partial [Deltaproteobacteria bacterium]|nr:hypothetical protein [Deltaproteobacteria bacterium]
GDCDVPEYCLETGECPIDRHEPKGTACGDPSDTVCDDPDTCDNQGECLVNHEVLTTVCRADEGECDVPEYCDAAGACPVNGFEPEGTPCGDDTDTVCDNPDTCDDYGVCLVNHEDITVLCRGDMGECDVPEYCLETGECPIDRHEPKGTACGDPSDTVCDDPDTCDSQGECLVNHEVLTTVCRTDEGDCDVPERCNELGECPEDGFEPAGTTCGDPNDSVCDDPDTCDDSGVCLVNHEPTTLVCRPEAGWCDLPELCNELGECPVDAYVPTGIECRGVAGDCDVPEACTGFDPECPTDAFIPYDTVCRPSVDLCDPPEHCTGVDPTCPTDHFATCTLCGSKFYDANANGTWNSTESAVADWLIELAGETTATVATTDQDGTYVFADLAEGLYVVCEAMPEEGNWNQTAPTEICYEVTVPSEDASSCLLDFGNLCLGSGGGHTCGFWHNKNGQSVFMNGDKGQAALALLRSLDLYDARGNAFDPYRYAEYVAWLKKRTAVNMAYQLSAQLSAMVLNLHFGFVDPEALVYAPDALSANELGYVTVERLVTETRRALAKYGYTPALSPGRTWHATLERALNLANSDVSFVQAEACDYTFFDLAP